MELGESNKRVVQNYSTPSRRIYTSTVTAGGQKTFPGTMFPEMSLFITGFIDLLPEGARHS